jgi:glycosyltransferase involved in cell wall biosynthesis
MKIAAIATSSIPSTTANSIQVMKVSQALVQSGHHLNLFVPQQRSEAFSKVVFDLNTHYGLRTSFPVTWLPGVRGLRRYDFSLSAVRQAQLMGADLVYSWPLQAAFFALRMRIPVILELHGPPEGRLGPVLFRSILKMSGRRRVLVITHALKKIIQYKYPQLRNDEIVVVPNGVEVERYVDLPDSQAARSDLRLPEKFTAVYTGHLYPGRGMSLLEELARRFPQVQFVCIGGRSEHVQAWRAKLDSLSIQNMLLLGFIPNQELPLYQAAADVLLMPYERFISGSSGGNSASYASPMKMFDYMATRRAILSSDLPVIREVLNDGNSMLRPPENSAAWADAFAHLLEDEDLRQSLAEQAWQDVQAYTWVKRAQKALAGF